MGICWKDPYGTGNKEWIWIWFVGTEPFPLVTAPLLNTNPIVVPVILL